MKIVKITDVYGDVFTAFLECGESSSNVLTFNKKFQGKIAHILSTANVKNFTNLIASYIIRKYKIGDTKLYLSVEIFDENFCWLDCCYVVYPSDVKADEKDCTYIDGFKFDLATVTFIEDVDGVTHKFELKSLQNSEKYTEKSPAYKGFKYTKCEEVNLLLYICSEPENYDKNLSKLFSDTFRRIIEFKSLGYDVYLNKKRNTIVACWDYTNPKNDKNNGTVYSTAEIKKNNFIFNFRTKHCSDSFNKHFESMTKL